jgi:hypothetical protein
LGINIFLQPEFDTWVLQTVGARIGDNQTGNVQGDDVFTSIGEYTPFFNHSCKPYVRVDSLENGSTLIFQTLMPIHGGEELFISYLPEEGLHMSVEERHQKLTENEAMVKCLCKRWAKERAEQDSEQITDAEDYSSDDDYAP